MTTKVIGSIAKVISSAIYLLIIVAVIVALLPMIAGFKPIVVLSGSMEPTYPVGSVIYYKATTYEDIAIGDAITFKIGGGALATHRVIEKNDELQEFTTKGDNNPTEDANPIAYQSVVGKTAKIAIPYAGVIATHLKEIPVIIGLGAILIICSGLTPSKAKQTKDESEV